VHKLNSIEPFNLTNVFNINFIRQRYSKAVENDPTMVTTDQCQLQIWLWKEQSWLQLRRIT